MFGGSAAARNENSHRMDICNAMDMIQETPEQQDMLKRPDEAAIVDRLGGYAGE